MRNLLNKATGTAIALAAATLLSSGSANAQATVRIDTLSCGVLDAANVVHVISAPNAVVQAVLTPSGNPKITCNGMLPVEATLPTKGATVVTFDDLRFPCGTSFGSSDDWQNVVTKSGRVSLVCHINGQP